MTKKVTKQLVLRVSEEEKDEIARLAKEQKKSVQKFIIDSILLAQNNQKDSTFKDEFIADLQLQLQKKEEEINKLYQLVNQAQQLVLNEQQKNTLLLSENETTKKWWKFW